MEMGRDASGGEAAREETVNSHIEQATVRSESLKRTLAITALGAGGIATIVWIVFLGWALTEGLATSLLRREVHPIFQRGVGAAPRQQGKAYRQPSYLAKKPPKHS